MRYAQSKAYEICGLIVHDPFYRAYHPEYPFFACQNIADNPSECFEISVDDFLYWEKRHMPVVAVVHSHPNGEPFLSGADRQAQLATGLPWILAVSGSLKCFQPVPYLRGRVFEYGVNDCYRLIQDAYHLGGVDLLDVPRTDLDTDAANNAFMHYVEQAGFYPVDHVQAGDMILTASGATPDHAMLYLGNGEILHHALDQLSGRVAYGQYWQLKTHSVWRHKKWLPEMMAAIEADLGHSH